MAGHPCSIQGKGQLRPAGSWSASCYLRNLSPCLLLRSLHTAALHQQRLIIQGESGNRGIMLGFSRGSADCPPRTRELGAWRCTASGLRPLPQPCNLRPQTLLQAVKMPRTTCCTATTYRQRAGAAGAVVARDGGRVWRLAGGARTQHVWRMLTAVPARRSPGREGSS